MLIFDLMIIVEEDYSHKDTRPKVVLPVLPPTWYTDASWAIQVIHAVILT